MGASWGERPYMAYAIAELCGSAKGTAEIMHRYRGKFLGLSLDGMLLIEHAAVTPKLGAMYCFILCEGEFRLSEDWRPLLVGSTRWTGKSYNCGVDLQTTLQPFDHFGGAPLEFQASLGEESISLHCTSTH
jgi:hypothetical protein